MFVLMVGGVGYICISLSTSFCYPLCPRVMLQQRSGGNEDLSHTVAIKLNFKHEFSPVVF